MDHLWAVGEPQPVRSVQEQLAVERTIAYTTVMTVMDNLYRKGLLDRVRDGRAYVYSPKQSREEHTAALLGDVLAEGGNRQGVLMLFVDALDDDGLESLRQVLDEPKRQGRGAT